MIEKEPMEVWQNLLPGTTWVIKTDQRGSESTEVIAGNKKFSISRTDRILNQERAASPRQDMFSNGMLQPVRLLDGDETAADLASNPNLISESEMHELLRSHFKTIEKRISEITNPLTLERLVKVAEEEDVSIKMMERLQARLAELDPNRPHEVDTSMGHVLPNGEGRKPNAVSPK